MVGALKTARNFASGRFDLEFPLGTSSFYGTLRNHTMRTMRRAPARAPEGVEVIWKRRGVSLRGAATLTAAAWISAASAAPANLSPGISVKFRPIAQLRSSAPSSTASVANATNITTHPALPSSLAGSVYNNWLTVADSRGRVSLVNASSYSAGVTNPNRTIVDLRTATQGLNIGNTTSGNSELGLRWFAYHPDFARAGAKGYLKAYTMSCHATSTRTLTGAAPLYHGVPVGAPQTQPCDNVLTEWRLNASTMTASSPRQVMRWPQLYTNHGTDALVFSEITKLLYVAVGDGGSQGDPHNVGQNKEYVYGKILRIDPTLPGTTVPENMVKSWDGRWSHPADNPYANTSGRNAIYVLGLRHPETMIKDGPDLFVFDIGGSAFEEVNFIKMDGDEGRNFGWDRVEGRSPADSTTLPPVAGYPHVNGNRAIIGGAAPDIGPFAGKVILGDIVSGNVYYGDRNAMKVARAWNIPMVPLQQFVMHNNAGTPQTLMSAFGRNSRVDLRLTEISGGRVIGVSKQRGIVFEIIPR